MAISGLHIAFAALLAAGLIRSGQIFSAWALDPLANTINWRNLLCCFLCLVDGMQPPALRTMVALATWGMLKLSGRQWSGWDVWICCLAAIFADGSLLPFSRKVYGSLPLRSRH